MSSVRTRLILTLGSAACLVGALALSGVSVRADEKPVATPSAKPEGRLYIDRDGKQIWEPASSTTQPAYKAEGNVANPADVLARLASPEYETRVAAMEQLIADDSVTIGQLLNLYDMTTVPEQRHRILDVARHVFVRAQVKTAPFMENDSGRVGIKMPLTLRTPRTPETSMEVPMGGVRVLATVLGFGAHGRLRAGDLVTEVNGVTIRGGEAGDEYQENFGAIIRAFKPGTRIDLTVFRDGATLHIPVLIGSANAFDLIYHPFGLRTNYLEQWLRLRAQFVAIDPLHGWLSPTASVNPENN